MPRLPDAARAAARKAGEPHYTSATPCSHGHPAPLQRYTSTGACVVCVAGQPRRPRAVPVLDAPATTAARDPVADLLG